MENRIAIEGRDGTFHAYVVRPKTLPSPAVVVLHEVFGVNGDIRTTCDELAERGYVAIAPDLFWRQEPDVDLSVTSESDWQHGLRLYQAYDRDAGAKDVKDAANVAAGLPECSGRVGILGYCLGGLMTFLTAMRYGVDAAVVYHGGDTEKYLGEIGGLTARPPALRGPGRGSELEHDAGAGGPGDADHHRPAVLLLLGGEHGVAMLDLAVDDGHLARAAGADAAARQGEHAVLLGDLARRPPSL